MLKLRPYQRAAIDSIYAYFMQGGDGNPIVVAPTGSGKSLLLATLCKETLERWPDQRLVIVAHRKELLQQNFEELIRLWPEAPAGLYSAGLKARQLGRKITIGGIQSIYNKAAAIGWKSLILVDECHLIASEGEGMYRTFIADMRKINPNIKVIGFTATPFRMKSGMLIEPGGIFTDIAYDITVIELIKNGFLCPVISKAPETQADLSDVRVRGGEYVPGEAEAAMNTEALTRAAIKEINRFASDRKSILVFCAGVQHAEDFAKALREEGQTAECVSGETEDLFRAQHIDGFKKGRIRFITNCDILTTGFNAPNVDCIVFLRPTKSTGLYVQVIGRGMRLFEGKENCIAEGQLILTDRGMVPIEEVTLDMRVWDGCAFVSHCGTVFRGEQETIEYAGLVATPDHKVWTKEGWRTFGECAEKQVPISVTENGGHEIGLAEGYFRQDISQGRTQVEQAGVSNDALHGMRQVRNQRLQHDQTGDSRVSKVWAEAQFGQAMLGYSEVVAQSLYLCQAALYKSVRSFLGEIRWSWNQILLWQSELNGTLVTRQLRRLAARVRDRSNRQRWALCAGQLAILDRLAERVSYSTPTFECGDTSLSSSSSKNSICRQHATRVFRQGDDIRANCREVPPSITQTKRRVWDILNAGPLHRFTAQGLLVSNCLVLDFAGNIERHGPIDMVRVQRKSGEKDGKEVSVAPVKICPQCRNACLIMFRACPYCGHEFPDAREPKHATVASMAPILASELPVEELEVESVDYKIHRKEGKPPSLRVTYNCKRGKGNLGIKMISEWVCFEHQGYAYQKAIQWWFRHHRDYEHPETVKAPMTSADAMTRVGELRPVRAIETRMENGFDRVLKVRFKEAQQVPLAIPTSAAEPETEDDFMAKYNI